MATSRIIKFPEKEKKETGKKGKPDPREKLSKELLQELQKDEAYREFASAEEVYKLIGESLGKVRKAKKMSVADLAQKVGKSEKIILRMEKGEYKQYTMKLLLQLAHALKAKLRIQYE
ncbi:helix-turn-helix domain-containing protein [bacterium]|nr:helix-turn-helix domain-containing protein [bacterium]MCI0603935.1 helix-turn-helix domain-containing protein [bacterium]